MTDASQTNASVAATMALALSILLASLGVSIATVALPSLARDLSATVPSVQWVVVAFLLAVTVSIVTVGRLGDVYGRRFVLNGGLVLFAAGSLLSTLAPDLATLVAGRAVQGVGAAALMALPIAIARDTVAPSRIGAAMGVLGAMSALGTALGPSVGGILLAQWGWRSAFAMLCIVAMTVLGLVFWAVPETPPQERSAGHVGIWSSAALALGLVGYALVLLGGPGDATGGPVFFGFVALVGLFMFGGLEARARVPLMPLNLLRTPAISAALTMNVLITTVLMATLVVGPYFLAFGRGLGEAQVGMVMAVGPIAATLAGLPAGRLTDRFGAAAMQRVGLAQVVGGLMAFALLPPVLGVAGYALAMVVLTPGFQLFLAANNTIVMMAAPAGERGVLSGLLGLSRNLGFLTGASAMAVLFASTLGSVPVALAEPAAISAAFSLTFLMAAGLAAMALVLALLVRPRMVEP